MRVLYRRAGLHEVHFRQVAVFRRFSWQTGALPLPLRHRPSAQGATDLLAGVVRSTRGFTEHGTGRDSGCWWLRHVAFEAHEGEGIVPGRNVGGKGEHRSRIEALDKQHNTTTCKEGRHMDASTCTCACACGMCSSRQKGGDTHGLDFPASKKRPASRREASRRTSWEYAEGPLCATLPSLHVSPPSVLWRTLRSERRLVSPTVESSSKSLACVARAVLGLYDEPAAGCLV